MLGLMSTDPVRNTLQISQLPRTCVCSLLTSPLVNSAGHPLPLIQERYIQSCDCEHHLWRRCKLPFFFFRFTTCNTYCDMTLAILPIFFNWEILPQGSLLAGGCSQPDLTIFVRQIQQVLSFVFPLLSIYLLMFTLHHEHRDADLIDRVFKPLPRSQANRSWLSLSLADHTISYTRNFNVNRLLVPLKVQIL